MTLYRIQFERTVFEKNRRGDFEKSSAIKIFPAEQTTDALALIVVFGTGLMVTAGMHDEIPVHDGDVLRTAGQRSSKICRRRGHCGNAREP